MPPTYVSIVIPTFNRSRLLAKTIPALVNQQTDGIGYEVIFVSNGSSDNTDAMLQEAASRHPETLRFHRIEPTGGPSAPRNVGIRAATGEVVIILDDDVLPDPDMVLAYARFHQAHPEPHHAAVGELRVPAELLDDPISRFHSFDFDALRRLDRLSYLHFWTCSVSVKREFMLTAGMFDESFLAHEDLECGYRLARNGMHLHFLPEAGGLHLHQLQPSGIPARGVFIGRWLPAFLEAVPDREAKEAFGILAWELGPRILIKRLLRRFALRAVSNPISMAFLRLLGATRMKRNRLTDLYYYALFRRHMLAAYYQAKREARAGAVDRTGAEWTSRAES